MRADLTDITVVLDRSGSMSSCKTDAEGGFNTFVSEQAKQEGEAVLTLVQFDGEYEFVHKAVNVKNIPKFSLVPRGGTALLDAIGRAIIETGERLKLMAEDQRPGLIVFVILTDGHENQSREFTNAKIKEMIEHQTTVYKWQFTYLGASADAFDVAHTMGIQRSSAAIYSSSVVDIAFTNTSGKVSRMREGMMATGARHGGLSGHWDGGESLDDYTDQERTSMVDPAK